MTESFTKDDHTFHVYGNHDLDQDTLNQLQEYVPGWYPPPTPGFMTICVEHKDEIGIYQVERILNLFTICPKYMDDVDHLNTHIIGILRFIHDLIKDTTTVNIANDIGFKIAFYKPEELPMVSFTGWYGVWSYTKKTSKTICGTSYPVSLPEYLAHWKFDNNYRIKGNSGAVSSTWTWGH